MKKLLILGGKIKRKEGKFGILQCSFVNNDFRFIKYRILNLLDYRVFLLRGWGKSVDGLAEKGR